MRWAEGKDVEVTGRSLLKARLEWLMPAREDDPAVEAHARRLLAERPDRFGVLFDLTSRVVGTSDLPRPAWLDDLIAGRRLDLALEASRVQLLRVNQRFQRQAIVSCHEGVLLSTASVDDEATDREWIVEASTLMSSIGTSIYAALIAWVDAESRRVARFVARFLAELHETAAAQTEQGIASLIVLLLSGLTDGSSPIGHLADPLIRRVLAPGGKTAAYIPLT